MPDTKISALTALLNTEIAPTDLVPVVDVSAGANGSKQVTVDVLFQSILGRVTNGVVTKTASFTPAAGEVVLLCDATSAVITVSLPVASTVPNKLYFIKKSDSSINRVTIDAPFIDGMGAIQLRAVNHGAVVVSNGTNWFAIASVGGGGGWTALTEGPTITADCKYGWDFEFEVTLAGNRTLAVPANPAEGQIITYRLKQDGTGSRTITLASGYVVPSDLTITLSTAANTTDILTAVYIKAADKWLVNGFIKGATGI